MLETRQLVFGAHSFLDLGAGVEEAQGEEAQVPTLVIQRLAEGV